MSSNLIIPKAKDIAKDEYENNNLIRTPTAGNRKHKNIMNAMYGTKCNERTIDERDNSLVNYPSTVPNIFLVQKIIGVINGIEYFTEATKKDLHFVITTWNNCNRNYFDFSIPIEHYQRTFNIPSIEEARERIKITARILISCSIIILDNSKSNYSVTNFPMFKHFNYKKNVINVVFFEDFFNSLKGINSFIFIDPIFYRLPSTSSLLYWRLINHKKMNVNKYNENIISVSSLLESCTSLPSEDKIKENLTNRIKKPFQKGMERLCEDGILKEWHYCRSNGTPLSEKELYEDRSLYKKFKTYYVKYEMNNKAYENELKKLYLQSQKNKQNYQNRAKNRKKVS
jgi:hypothetical protein